MSIAELKPGQRAQVQHVTGNGAIRQRLLEMGLMPRTQLQVERTAPSGDPIWIKVHGYQLSLRRSEASTILVVDCE
jgi:ferrous iron transport protein A